MARHMSMIYAIQTRMECADLSAAEARSAWEVVLRELEDPGSQSPNAFVMIVRDALMGPTAIWPDTGGAQYRLSPARAASAQD